MNFLLLHEDRGSSCAESHFPSLVRVMAVRVPSADGCGSAENVAPVLRLLFRRMRLYLQHQAAHFRRTALPRPIAGTSAVLETGNACVWVDVLWVFFFFFNYLSFLAVQGVWDVFIAVSDLIQFSYWASISQRSFCKAFSVRRRGKALENAVLPTQPSGFQCAIAVIITSLCCSLHYSRGKALSDNDVCAACELEPRHRSQFALQIDVE